MNQPKVNIPVFESRQSQRKVVETIDALLLPLKDHCNDETKECIEIALKLLSYVPIREELGEVMKRE
jgi:hypothetical protein